LCQSASRVKLIHGLSSTSKVEDLWTTRLGTAYCHQTPFSLVVVALSPCTTHPIWLRQLLVAEIRTYSRQQTGELVERAIQDAREQSGLPQLTPVSLQKLDNIVCQLAQDGTLTARSLVGSERTRGVVTYSQSRPGVLPKGALRLLKDRATSRFAAGTCYARNATNPSGMYWVAILLY
jgi:hypothetical protein